MTGDKPHLTIVGTDYISEHDLEFEPLPYFPWAERPLTVPLTIEECATALHLEHGDKKAAARLLRVPYVRIDRFIRGSPRLQRVWEESLGEALAEAASVPIQTLFDPTADARRREWASTKVLQSRLAIGHPLSPAPASTVQSNAILTANPTQRTLTFRWRTDDDDAGPGDEAG